LASRHHSLQMGEVADVMDLLQGFEKQNRIHVEIRFGVLLLEGRPDLVVTGTLFTLETADVEPVLFSSVSVPALRTGLRNLRDVVTHVLYALDFRLALDEFESATPKKA